VEPSTLLQRVESRNAGGIGRGPNGVLLIKGVPGDAPFYLSLSLSFFFSLFFLLSIFLSSRPVFCFNKKWVFSKVEGRGWERQRLSCRRHRAHGSALGPASRNNNYLSRVLWCPPTCSHPAQKSYIGVPGGRRKSRICASPGVCERDTCLWTWKIEITIQSQKLQDWWCATCEKW